MTSTMILTVNQAEDLAARTLAAIDERDWYFRDEHDKQRLADRERVASDLAGLRHTWALYEAERLSWENWSPLHAAFSDGLVRTARLYGVSL